MAEETRQADIYELKGPGIDITALSGGPFAPSCIRPRYCAGPKVRPCSSSRPGMLARTADAGLEALGQALVAPFGAQGAKARRLQVVLALALDFWTWHRLEREGLDDVAAAELMAGLVAAVA